MNNENDTKFFLNYSLRDLQDEPKVTAKSAFKKMWPYLKDEKKNLIISSIMTLVNAASSLIVPLGIGYSIDKYVIPGNYPGVLMAAGILLAVAATAFVSNYIQYRVMGGVAQRLLWGLRNSLFVKLQELPLAFFNANKAGDLISRVNRDTQKVNEFFTQGLLRFVQNIFLIGGAGIFILVIQWKLGTAALLPVIVLAIFTKSISSWVGSVNKKSNKAAGLLSGEIQESIANFKVILAFNRRDYFKKRFGDSNRDNFKGAVKAGIANELYTPVYEWMGNIALIITLSYGLYLISKGDFAIGLLVSYVMYVTRFYDPLREMARMAASLQTALASWDRIGHILRLKSNLEIISEGKKDGKGLIEFRNVSFGYENKQVLRNVNFVFEKGKTYALVGPTGGGKTTTASLIARLYDPVSGTIYLDGKDIRSINPVLRTKKIGFILQEPFLFSGTVKDNLIYGIESFKNISDEDFLKKMDGHGFTPLIEKFEKGLKTKIDGSGTLSLGERQIIAFMRAVLREPEILILDEATANIDTVTEQVLEDILSKLPKDTTRVIIAHRLNTIANADDIFFVNGGEVKEAGSMEHAVEMLLHGKRSS
jgi:ATP-binding cassette subfamily B protein